MIQQKNCSVPVFDQAIPSGSGHLTGLVRVPEDRDAAVVVGLPLGHHLSALPVPDAALAVTVSADDVTEMMKSK